MKFELMSLPYAQTALEPYCVYRSIRTAGSVDIRTVI
jgi:hypothetical protein